VWKSFGVVGEFGGVGEFLSIKESLIVVNHIQSRLRTAVRFEGTAVTALARYHAYRNDAASSMIVSELFILNHGSAYLGTQESTPELSGVHVVPLNDSRTAHRHQTFLPYLIYDVANCDGFSHVVSNKSTMQVCRTTSYFCVRDKGSLQPLLLRGHTRAGR
jgi:hypothetical protein